MTVNTSMENYKDIVCDANNLYKAYEASIKASKWKESTQRYMLHFLDYIFDLQSVLEEERLTNDRTREFILYERGSRRAINSLSVKDKIVRHILCDDIFIPKVRRKIIYDNGASLKGRGIHFQRNRFEIHLRKFYKQYGNDGYILFGDFRKFYDNIPHQIAKDMLLDLVDYDDYISYLLDVIFDSFKIDVSFLSDNEYDNYINSIFNKNEWRTIPKSYLTKEKFMYKSVNIGDQLSQIIGVYYTNEIDTYVKYVRSQKFYGRYMDDWYIMSSSKEELIDILEHIKIIASGLGICINENKTRIIKISSTFKFLQIRYTLTKTGKVIKKINPKRVTAMRKKLKKLANKVDLKELPYENVESMFRAWMCEYYKYMSNNTRKNLIRLYEDLFSVRIKIINKKMIFEGVSHADATQYE